MQYNKREYYKANNKQTMARNVLSGKDNTNGFQKNPQNINRSGANRKTISTVNVQLEELGYTEATSKDITSCYLRLINVDKPELEKMINDPKQPVMIRIVGSAIISGKGFDVIENMLNRSLGKAQSNLDITTNGEKINTDPFAKIRENNGIDAKTETGT